MNYLPNDFSFPVSLGIFGMKLPFKKHQLNLQTSTGPSWCLFPYYFSLCERILRRIRQRCRLVVIDVLHRNPNILKYLKQSLSVMSECNRSVMRIILLDQNVTICFDKSTYPIAAPASVAFFLNYYLNFIFYLHFYIIRIIFSKQAYEQKTALLVQNSTIYHNKKREPLHNICKSSLFSCLNLYSSIQNKIVTINFPCIFFIL